MADGRNSKGGALVRRGTDAGLPIVPAEAPDLPEETIAALTHTLAARLKPRTQKEYAEAWKRFQAWCKESNVTALPAHTTTICAYLEHLASNEQVSMSTVNIAVASISHYHKLEFNQLSPPTSAPIVSDYVDALKRKYGTPKQKKLPLIDAVLRKLLITMPTEGWTNRRNRAIILFGRAFAGRREEIVNVRVEHLTKFEHGYMVFIPESKGDRYNEGESVPVVYAEDKELCGAYAIETWIAQSQVTGYLFPKQDGSRLDPSVVARAVKNACLAAGLSKEDTKRFAAHSLRSGHATQAALNGAPDNLIQRQLRHKKIDTTNEYIQRARLELENTGAYLGKVNK